MLNKDWYKKIPKVELHLHLEGAIPYQALWALVEKYGGDSSVPTLNHLKEKFIFRDFPHFIDTWVWKNQFLREYADFTFIAEAVAHDLAGQNIRYAEIFFSPPDFHRYGLSTQGLAEAIWAGISRVPEIEIALVPDVVRDFGPQKAAVTLAEINEAREYGIIGIGLGGSEHNHPPEPYREVYAQARKMGFYTSVHAGEAAGPTSVWGAIQVLQPDRIGHGTRVGEDPLLIEYLVERQIPIEMCPISNVCTGVVGQLVNHPIRSYFERGLCLTVNTDDPKMFGNSLADEYQALEIELGFLPEDIQTLILNAIHSSWLPAERKEQLVLEFQRDPSWREFSKIVQ
jgi:adenosine deaminase